MTQTQIRESKPPISRTRVVGSQVLACLALDLLLVGLGMSISFVTMVLPEVLDAKEGLSINEKQASWFGGMAFLCQPLGSIFSGPLLDYFGRKKALFLVNIPHLIAWLLMYYAWNVPSLFIANALLGIGTGIMEAPSVTYVGEVSDSSVRGILTTLTNSFTSTGMFLSYLLGTVLPWRQAALVSLTVPLATMLVVLFVTNIIRFIFKFCNIPCPLAPRPRNQPVPETPIWLLSKGRQKEALRSLCQLRGWCPPDDVKDEFDQLLKYNDAIHQCVICLKEDKPTLACEHMKAPLIKRIVLKCKHVFLVKETMRPFTLVMAYFLFYLFSGLMPIRPNMINFCKALGMKYETKTIVVLVGAVFIVMNLLTAVIVKLIGKRKLVIGSMAATALCSLFISIYAGTNLPRDLFSYEPHTFPEPTDTLPVVLFMMLVCFTSLGIPWVVLSEVFPFRSRGMATGMAAACSYVMLFIATKTNYNIELTLHLSGAFTIYAIFGFLGSLYLYFYLPETENKTLLEIEAFYKGNRKIFADDFLINSFRKKSSNDANAPMLVN